MESIRDLYMCQSEGWYAIYVGFMVYGIWYMVDSRCLDLPLSPISKLRLPSVFQSTYRVSSHSRPQKSQDPHKICGPRGKSRTFFLNEIFFAVSGNETESLTLSQSISLYFYSLFHNQSKEDVLTRTRVQTEMTQFSFLFASFYACMSQCLST